MRLAGVRWSGRTIQAANVIGESTILSVMKRGALEAKVTLAGCVLANLARLDTASRANDVISRAVDDLGLVEKLHPFLGDDEWEDISPR